MAIALNDGLIGYWSLNKGTGAVAYDKTGNGNDGALEGTTPTWVNGMSGSAVNFPGADERIDCGNGAPLDDLGSGDFSVSFWMKSLDAVPLNYGTLFSKYPQGTDGILIDAYTTQDRLRLYVKKGVDSVNAPFSVATTPFDAAWHHIALVVNRTTDLAALYMDTVKDDEEPDLSGLPGDCSCTVNIAWGARHDGTQPYEGALDELRIYDRVLNEDEIDYLHTYPGGGRAIRRRRRM